MVKYSFFSYKKGNSFSHKCPSWLKIIFIPFINVLFFCLPPEFSLILIVIQTFIAFYLKFSLQEQIEDLKPIFFYAILLLFYQLFLCLFSENFVENLKSQFSWKQQKDTIFLLVKLFSIMQTSSLVFKTSTSLEMREGISKIFGQKSVLTNAISMFLNFIPMISKIWQQSKMAWKIRGGKNGIKMYFVLLPVLFSVGMKKAYNLAKAVQIRN